MGGTTTTTRAATLLADHVSTSGSYAWAFYLIVAHREAMDMQASFLGSKLNTISLVDPKGNIIQSSDDPHLLLLH